MEYKHAYWSKWQSNSSQGIITVFVLTQKWIDSDGRNKFNFINNYEVLSLTDKCCRHPFQFLVTKVCTCMYNLMTKIIN